MHKQYGFTLIELLVVITIIVVLLALLTPALDKAIYQAELAVCGTNLDAVATGAISYAGGNKRRYPARPLIDEENWEVNSIFMPWDPEVTDMRPILREYMSINKSLLDPLCDEVDFEGSLPGSYLFVSYNLWFGFKYRGAGAGAGMMRMGDSWGFTSDDRRHRFKVMVADGDLIEAGNTTAFASHPDHDGLMTNVVWQDASIVDGGQGGATALLGQVGNLNVTSSVWWIADGSTQERGPIDMNAAFDDGSVHRYNQAMWDEAIPTAESYSGRFARVPQFSNADDAEGFPENWINAPLR